MMQTATYLTLPLNTDLGHENSFPSEIECCEEFTQDGRKWVRCTFPDCGKTFRYKSEISRHQVIHFKSRPFMCDHPGCGKTFKRQDGLETHVRTHTKVSPFECKFPDCGQSFTTRASLRYHVLKHKDQPTYKCSFEGCDKCFLTQAQLKQHEKTINYHKKIGMTRPKEQQQPELTSVSMTKLPSKKEENQYFAQFFAAPARAPEEIQWEVMDLTEEDNVQSNEMLPQINFDEIMPESAQEVQEQQFTEVEPQKKLCVTKNTSDFIQLPSKEKKGEDHLYNQFFLAPARASEEIQFEMKDLAEEDDCDTDDNNTNFANILKYMLDDSKVLKQNEDLHSKLMSAIQENYELKSKITTIQDNYEPFTQTVPQFRTEEPEPIVFFDQNDFDLLDFLKDGAQNCF